MPKIKLKQVDEISRKTVSYAFTAFMRHCKLVEENQLEITE